MIIIVNKIRVRSNTGDVCFMNNVSMRNASLPLPSVGQRACHASFYMVWMKWNKSLSLAVGIIILTE